MNKLGVKDLVNAGLFSVLMIIATFAAGMLGFIPIFIPVFPFFIGILSGPVFMLYSSKINKAGMFFIMSIVYAIVFGATGHGIYAFIGIPVLGIIGELILKSGSYKSINKSRFAYIVFMLYAVLNFLPLIFSREEYLARMAKDGYAPEYIEQYNQFMPTWAIVPVILFGCLGAFIGCTIGIKMLKKHFKRAGMID